MKPCVMVVVLVVLGLGTTASNNVQKLGSSSTQFGLDLYKELTKDPSMKNIFISPVSISLALSMVLLGARGEERVRACV